MKKIFEILLSLLTLLSCGLLSACSAEKAQPDTSDTETVWETVSYTHLVVDTNLVLALIISMKPSGILRQRSAP